MWSNERVTNAADLKCSGKDAGYIRQADTRQGEWKKLYCVALMMMVCWTQRTDEAVKELPTRTPNRLQGYDYSRNGYYFITICWEVSLLVHRRLPIAYAMVRDYPNMEETLIPRRLTLLTRFHACHSIFSCLCIFIMILWKKSFQGRGFLCVSLILQGCAYMKKTIWLI